MSWMERCSVVIRYPAVRISGAREPQTPL